MCGPDTLCGFETNPLWMALSILGRCILFLIIILVFSSLLTRLVIYLRNPQKQKLVPDAGQNILKRDITVLNLISGFLFVASGITYFVLYRLQSEFFFFNWFGSLIIFFILMMVIKPMVYSQYGRANYKNAVRMLFNETVLSFVILLIVSMIIGVVLRSIPEML